MERLLREQDPTLLQPFLEGARALQEDGVAAITTNCVLAMFQREIAAAVRVPVSTSSLLLVPLVRRMLAPGRAVGIPTVNAATLGTRQLEGAGITPDIPLAIDGLETEEEFSRVLLGDLPRLDVDTARAEHVRVAQRMVAEDPEVGAIVLECTNTLAACRSACPSRRLATQLRLRRSTRGSGSRPPDPSGRGSGQLRSSRCAASARVIPTRTPAASRPPRDCRSSTSSAWCAG